MFEQAVRAMLDERREAEEARIVSVSSPSRRTIPLIKSCLVMQIV